MPWYIYSILASSLFVGMILCTRYLGNKGFFSKQILVFLLGFVFLGFFLLNLGSFNDIIESEHFGTFLFVMIIAGISSVIGNWTSFTSIIKSPNPGFSGAIKNVNILLITIFSVLILGSPLSFIKLVGVLLVIIGVAVVIIEKNNVSYKKADKFFSRWEVLSLIAAFGFTIAILAIKKASQLGFSSLQINFFLFGFNFLAFVFLTREEIKSYFQDKIKLKKFLPIVFLAATFSFLANLFNVKGVSIAPNPGYHQAIQGTQILITTLISVPLFGIKFNKRKLLGVVIVLLGTIILVI